MQSYFIPRCQVSNDDEVTGTELVFVIRLHYKILRVINMKVKYCLYNMVTCLASMVHQLST